MKPRIARILLVAGVVFLVVLCGSYFMLAPAGPRRRVVVRIPKGSSASRIGAILAGQGVIRSAFGFEVLARLSGKSSSLKPGAYELNPADGPIATLGKMVRGEAIAVWVTFPEGFTVRQMGERLQARGIGKADRFVRLAREAGGSFSTAFLHPGEDLEGYLFPDTYLVPVAASEQVMIQLMLDSLARKAIGPLAGDLAKSGMSFHEWVTLASMIEREAKLPRDRELISAVLHNRLARHMRLECDATVLYALGKHKSRVLYRDLAVDSPYNTYRHSGLPPGPIANPGSASLKAALNPADVDYLYYVATPDGSHVFSCTLAEHQRATEMVRRKRANKSP